MKKVLFSPLAVLFFFIFQSNTTTAQPVLTFNSFASGLSSPVDITNAGDGSNRLFIVQQGGTIRIHDGTSLLVTPFLNISSIITSGGERGLLSLAFHPDYETNRYFFVYYTNLSGDITIARYQTQAGDPNLADPLSGVVLLNIPKPFSNHNGGDLNFGPDGYLYFATGDGGSGGDPNNYAQTGTSLLGKMIRIDVSNFSTAPYYFIPADNPYVADPLVDDRIWALGLRNPWRWSFDRSTNDMWIADVGQGAWEEVNFRSTGATGGINYGWRCYEGNAAYNTAGCQPQSSYISPIFVYPHSFATGGFSITGGFVYRGAEHAGLFGYYICADYVSGNVWLINPDGGGGWTATMQSGLPGNISGFGEAEDATLFAVSLGGTVYKVDLSVVFPFTLLSFSGHKMNGYNELKWKTSDEQNMNRYIVEYSTDGVYFQYGGEVAARNQPGVQQYRFMHFTTGSGKIFYRLKAENLDRSINYSAVIGIDLKEGHIKVSPTFISDNLLRISSEKVMNRLIITDSYGRIVLRKELNGQQGFLTVQLPTVAKGMYWVKFETATGFEVFRIVIG
ncbi:MAG: T9SS type A sorting domain-containing protein [Chitinophagaceae bacterium]|nr:T9SS type A sorting domain-containing protein [Chitinophagaceae bacterium]